MAYITYQYKDLLRYCVDAFMKFGFTEEESKIITDVLLTSDLFGIESHGFQRLVRYYKAIQNGRTKRCHSIENAGRRVQRGARTVRRFGGWDLSPTAEPPNCSTTKQSSQRSVSSWP